MVEQGNTFDYINVDNNIHNIHREMLFFNCFKTLVLCQSLQTF